MTTPINSGFIQQMKGQFVHLNDHYNRWGNLISSYQAIPALRGLWPGQDISSGQDLADYSPERTNVPFAGIGSPQFNFYQLIPFVSLDGSIDYFESGSNIYNITGTKTRYPSSIRGLTLGAWLRHDGTSANTFTRIIAKTALGIDRAYSLSDTNSNTTLQFRVSPDGTSGAAATVENSNFAANGWHCVVARFTPSTELLLRIDNQTEINTTSIPASIFNAAANFTVGAVSGGGGYWEGDFSMGFICEIALSDAFINSFWETGKVPYGREGA